MLQCLSLSRNSKLWFLCTSKLPALWQALRLKLLALRVTCLLCHVYCRFSTDVMAAMLVYSQQRNFDYFFCLEHQDCLLFPLRLYEYQEYIWPEMASMMQ